MMMKALTWGKKLGMRLDTAYVPTHTIYPSHLAHTHIQVGLPSLSLHDLTIEVKWHRSGSCYWVKYAQCELLSGIDALRPGDSVCVKRSEFKSM